MDRGEVREVAYTALQTVAATMSDAALRQRYLTNVPERRDIEVAWAAQQAAASGVQ